MKLPNKLLLAIARYYINRSNQYEVAHNGNGYKIMERSKRSWNKDVDLDFIEKNCPEGMSYSAIAGTFWFSRGKKTIKIDESNFCEHVQ